MSIKIVIKKLRMFEKHSKKIFCQYLYKYYTNTKIDEIYSDSKIFYFSYSKDCNINTINNASYKLKDRNIQKFYKRNKKLKRNHPIGIDRICNTKYLDKNFIEEK